MVSGRRTATTGAEATVSEQVTDLINGYRPQHVTGEQWAQVGPLVRDATIKYSPTSVSGAYLTLRACAGFTLWAQDHDLSLLAEDLYVEDYVEHYARRACGT